jgi:NTE family protein
MLWIERYERPVPHDRKGREGTALCLSGGGYRAMLFHLGALLRLNELGMLLALDFVSSVSGGSITAGVLAANWAKLQFDDRGVARNLDDLVARPLLALSARTLDVKTVALGVLSGSTSRSLARSYSDLFGKLTLQDLPDRPRFIFNATNLQSGALWRFSRKYMRDWKTGEVIAPAVRLTDCVAASSAFPPFLSPAVLSVAASDWTVGGGEWRLSAARGRVRVPLTDGGVYDNLALEAVAKRCSRILVSDGGASFQQSLSLYRSWLCQLLRVLQVVDSQVRALRKRELIRQFQIGEVEGAYWGIGTRLANYELGDAIAVREEVVNRFAFHPTRLARIDLERRNSLVNWGYAVSDAALRRYVLPGKPPHGLPLPGKLE